MTATAARGADPVTLQIVGNALASIADEMATTIFRTAHSTVVRDGSRCLPSGAVRYSPSTWPVLVSTLTMVPRPEQAIQMRGNVSTFSLSCS